MTDDEEKAQTRARAQLMRELPLEERNRLIAEGENVVDARPHLTAMRKGRWR